jgi:hypothetical protein
MDLRVLEGLGSKIIHDYIDNFIASGRGGLIIRVQFVGPWIATSYASTVAHLSAWHLAWFSHCCVSAFTSLIARLRLVTWLFDFKVWFSFWLIVAESWFAL